MPKLTFILDSGQEINVDLKPRTTVGRDEANDVVVDDHRLDERHAEICLDLGGACQVRDLGSSAGTFVNGYRIEDSPLRAGDRVSFGPLTGIFERDGTPAHRLMSHRRITNADAVQVSGGSSSSYNPTRMEAQAALHLTLADLRGEVKELTEIRDQVAAEMKDAEQRTQTAQKDFAELTAKLEAARQEIAERTTALADLRHQQEELGDVHTALAEAESQHESISAAVEATMAEHADWQGRIQELREAHGQWESLVDEEHSKVTNAEQETQAAKAELITAQQETEAQQARLAELRAEEASLAQVTQQLDEAQRQLAETRTTHEELQGTKGTIEQQIEASQQQHSEWLVKIETARADHEQHTASLTEVQNELTSLRRDRDRSQEILSHLRADEIALAHVTEKLSTAETQQGDLLGELQRLSDDHEALLQKFLERQQHHATLESNIGSAQETLQELDQRSASVREEITSAVAEREAHRQSIERLREEEQSLDHISAALLTAEATHSERQDVLKALQAQIEDHQAQLMQLKLDGQEHQDRLASLTAQHGASEAQLESLRFEHESTQARKTALEEDIRHLENRKAEVNQQLDEAYQQKCTRLDEIAGLERQVTELHESAQSTEARIAELTGAHERLQQAHEEAQSLSDQILAKQNHLSDVTAEHATCAGALEELHSQLTQREAEHGDAQTRLQNTQAEIAQHQDALHQLKAETEQHVQSATQQKAELEQSCATLRHELTELETRVSEQQTQSAELHRQVEELAGVTEQLATTQASLAEVQARHAALQTEVKDSTTQSEALQHELEKLTSEESSVRERLEALKTEEAQLQTSLQTLNRQEQENRTRFEEVQRMTVDAEESARQQKIELECGLAVTRREWSELTTSLAPIQAWKRALDERQEWLEALPGDSWEAKQLVVEIEEQKRRLAELNIAASTASGSAPNTESTVEALSSSVHESAASEAPRRRGLFQSAAGDEPQEPRSAVGSNTGALHSSVGQEMALRARLNRLRDNVQREATRLEFLRKERSREETRSREQTAHQALETADYS